MSEDRNSIRHILVAHDFSDTAQHALDYALGLARKVGARVTIIHAYEVVTYAYAESVVVTAQFMKQVHDLATSALEALAKKSSEPGLEVGYELRAGSPRVEIVDFAKQAGVDLIVIGTHGRKGVARALLGSVAESVLRSAPCPVLTVRGQPS